MKIFIYVLMVLAAALVIYNSTLINFKDPFGDESIVAVITVLCGLCALLLLTILRTSQKIREKARRR